MIKAKTYVLLLLLILCSCKKPDYAQTSITSQKLTPLTFHYNTISDDYYLQSLEMKENRWERFPVTININQVPATYKTLVLSAINVWKPYIPLEITKSKNSNITISWANKLSLGRGFVGTAEHRYYNNIHKCTIQVLYKKRYSYMENEEILVHELGHAFGLDHSPNKQDIMFNTIKPYKKAIPGKKLISQRDLNTLYRIYANGNKT